MVRIPAELHERAWDRAIRPRNGRSKQSFQSILFEPVCAALRAASGDSTGDVVQPAANEAPDGGPSPEIHRGRKGRRRAIARPASPSTS